MPSYSVGIVLALLVLVVCVVGLLLTLFGQLPALPVAAALFLIGGTLAVARLT